MAESGRKNIDPRLLALIDKAETEQGLFVENLSAGDVVEMHTKSGNVYTFEVLDPATRKVKARDQRGTLSKEPVETYANGSSTSGTGTMIRMGWMAVGYRFVLGNALMTRTERVIVNGVQMLPRADHGKN